jgi:serine/threonine-protein kinase
VGRTGGRQGSKRSPALAIPIGKYQIIRRIAVGGAAEVFLGYTVERGRRQPVAIKRLLPQLATDRQIVAMFLDEARLLQRLDHPGVVRAHEVARTKKSYFIAMEFVHGASLDRIIAAGAEQQREIPLDHAARLGLEVCSVLGYVHRFDDGQGEQAGLIHRDISPQNIMLTYQGRVKVFDFGVARDLGALSRTRPAVLAGKTAYLSPEQVEQQELDARTDIYSLGCVLYELATGRKPFEADTELDTMLAIVKQPTPDPRAIDERIPDEYAELVMRAMHKDRERRTPDAQQLGGQLKAFLERRNAHLDAAAMAAWVREVVPPPRREDPPKDPLSAQMASSTPKGTAAPSVAGKPEPPQSSPGNQLPSEPQDSGEGGMAPPPQPPQPAMSLSDAGSPEAGSPEAGPPEAGSPAASDTPARTTRPSPTSTQPSAPLLSGLTQQRRSPAVWWLLGLLLLAGGVLGAWFGLADGGAPAPAGGPPAAPAADAGTAAGRQTEAGQQAAAEPIADAGETTGAAAAAEPAAAAAAPAAAPAAELAAGRAASARRGGKRPGAGRAVPRRGGGPGARRPGTGRSGDRRPGPPTAAPADRGRAPEPAWLDADEPRIEVAPDDRAAAEPAGDAGADGREPTADGGAAAGASAQPDAAGAADPTTAAADDEAGRDGGRPQRTAAASPAKPTYQPPEVVAKRRIAGRDPVYPPLARQAKLRATLLVKIYIEPDGTVGYTKFLKTHEVFEQAVREAIASWRFAPHRINGRPVGTYTVYKFVFQLD